MTRGGDDGGPSPRHGPPDPPALPRRLRIPPAQAVAVLALAAVVAVAALTLLDERHARHELAADGVAIEVEYPTRLRFGKPTSIGVHVANHSARAVDTVHVVVDAGYLADFSRVDLSPQPDDAHVIRLGPLAPGERSSARLELRAQRTGRRAGWIAVTVAGVETARADVETFVFP